MDSKIDMENKNIENWIKEGDEYREAGNNEEAADCYKKVIECFEETAQLDLNDAAALCNFGIALYRLANIKQDKDLFERAFEKFNKAEHLNPNNAFIFLHWGNALSDLAEMKQDEDLFKSSFEKYDKAIKIDPNYARAFNNWGIVLSDLAKIKKDEILFYSSFEKYDKAVQLNPNDASAFFNWGTVIFNLAEIKRDEALYKISFEKFEIATQLSPNDFSIFYNWGIAIFNLAEIKRDEALYKTSFEKFEIARQLNQNFADTFIYLGLVNLALADLKKDETLYKNSFKLFKIATKLEPNNIIAFYNLGFTLFELAKNKQDETFRKNLESFENESKSFDEPDILLLKGELFLLINQTEKVNEYFQESKKDILEILTILDEKNKEKILNTRILHSLLDSDNNDGKFFKETIEKLSPEQNKNFDAYKEIYIRSVFIISLLQVKFNEEKLVAHYREKEVSQKLIFDNDSKFRLNAIDYSNDPTEGKTLLDYLFEKGNYKTDEELNTDYEAFAACFVFDYDNLNMFRLYGKDDNKKEGTGLSLVFKDSFFSKEARMSIGASNKNSSNTNDKISLKEEKFALFRCIYIDPNPKTEQHIVTVGQKEEYLFYREENGNKVKDYKEKMNILIDNVRKNMEELKKLTRNNNLNSVIVEKLLLNLRYLVKHVAFKEEQECRIVKIFNLTNEVNLLKDKKNITDDNKQIFFEYQPKVSEHIYQIYFGPKAEGFEQFKNMLKFKGLTISCFKSDNPLT
jgi:tetratricopeptide (TPR) repeat protein